MRHVVPLFVLLAVGCGPLFTIGDDTKDSAAAVKAEQLLVYAKAHAGRNGGERLKSLDELTAYAEDGDTVVIDPWGERFKFAYVEDPETHTERLVVWTVTQKTEQVIAAPRQFAHLVPPRK